MRAILAAALAVSLLPGAVLASEMRAPGHEPSATVLQAQIDALKQQVSDLKKKVEALRNAHTTVCIAFRCA